MLSDVNILTPVIQCRQFYSPWQTLVNINYNNISLPNLIYQNRADDQNISDCSTECSNDNGNEIWYGHVWTVLDEATGSIELWKSVLICAVVSFCHYPSVISKYYIEIHALFL